MTGFIARHMFAKTTEESRDRLQKAHDELLTLDRELNELNRKLIVEIEVLNTRNSELRAEIEQRDQQISELMENVMIDAHIEPDPAIVKHSGKILMTLISHKHPESEIFSLYEEAEDKDAFVAGLIGNLILRHKQWKGQGVE